MATASFKFIRGQIRNVVPVPAIVLGVGGLANLGLLVLGVLFPEIPADSVEGVPPVPVGPRSWG